MGIALLSVSNKEGIVSFAKHLVGSGYDILSTGGTAELLRANNVPVTLVEEYTGSPEIFSGRVKTLHPKIHGGILAQRSKDTNEMREHEINPIDIVVVNLYPFEETIAKNVSQAEAIENIDVGGVTLLRAAAKNHNDVTVVCDPADYTRVAQELPNVSEETKKRLAVKAFQRTTAYDAAIHTYLRKEHLNEDVQHVQLTNGTTLRYGENPHQEATFYSDGSTGIGTAEQLHGKQLSYNNYLDGDAALAIALELQDTPAAVVVKHTNPCGIATGKTLKQALEAAWSGDVVSAFGSVIAFSKNVDLATAEFLKGKFVEMVIAPSYDDDALAFLRKKSKNVRVMRYGATEATRKQFRQVSGGILAQDSNTGLYETWKTVTNAAFPSEKEALAKFTTIACKHTKSNAVILGAEYVPGCYKVLGMGAGQPNRVDSLRKLAVTKAKENVEREDGDVANAFRETVLVSDAFFPFDDTVREAATFGIQYVVQPGGSIRDEEVINACNELGIAMVFTGMRHFKH